MFVCVSVRLIVSREAGESQSKMVSQIDRIGRRQLPAGTCSSAGGRPAGRARAGRGRGAAGRQKGREAGRAGGRQGRARVTLFLQVAKLYSN